MDRVSVEQRSWNMGRIRSRNTGPEMLVRRLLHRVGYRYRLHVSDLPGKPDLVFPSRKRIVLVHGCYWHRHPECRFTFTPKTHADFWNRKFAKNVERDSQVIRELRRGGWRVLVVWSCETGEPHPLFEKIVAFLDPENNWSGDLDAE